MTGFGMRIGIDGRELTGRPTGVGRYLANILAAWADMPEAREHSYVLYHPEGPATALTAPGPSPLAMTAQSVGGGGRSWWEQVRLPLALRRDRLDVFFAPGYSAPLMAGLPVVLTVHDLSFLAHPEWFRWRERTRRRWLTALSASRATRVLTVSQFSKSEIVRLLRVPAHRIDVVPQAAARLWTPVTARASQGPLGGREPIVLYVGSIFSRRRLRDLIRAFAIVARVHTELTLEIVGDDRSHPHEDLPAIAAGAGVADRVNIRAYVPDETLADLYSRAAVFAFLSEYEGFGLTPLEAMAQGVPPLVLDTEVAREVYGDAALYVPRDDLDETADALHRLLYDETARRALLDKAPAVLSRYSWRKTAHATLLALEGAARRSGGQGKATAAAVQGDRRA
jgi:glycosyltransferase involved in cell wall biosynthesis